MTTHFHLLIGSADPATGGMEASALRIAGHLSNLADTACTVYSRRKVSVGTREATRFVSLAEDRELLLEPLQPETKPDTAERYRLDALLFKARVEEALNGQSATQHVLLSFYLSNAGFIAQQVALDLRLPHIACVRGTDFSKDAQSPARFTAIRHVARHSDWLLTTNRQQESWFRATQQRSDRIQTVYNSVSDAVRLGEPWKPHSRDFVRLFADCGLSQKKATHVLLAAVAELRASGLPVELRLFGTAEEGQETYWSSVIERSQADDHHWCTFGGRVDEVRLVAELLESDVYCSATLGEGSSNGINKALALGIPIVATRTGALPDFAEAASHVALVPVANPRAYTEALRRMVLELQLGRISPDRTLIEAWRDQLSLTRERDAWRGIAERVVARRVPPAATKQPRLLFFVHDGVGLGHLQRISRIARKLQGPCACLVVTGHRAASWVVPETCEYVHLPSLDSLLPKKAQYWKRAPFLTIPHQEALELRGRILQAAFKSFRPDALFVDYLPAGKHNELRPLLDAPGIRRYFIMRGVLDQPSSVSLDVLGGAGEDLLATRYDRVLVASDQRVCDVVKEYSLSPQIAAKVTYTGYVVDPVTERVRRQARAERGIRSDEIWVVCSAGGGALGEQLIEECQRIAPLFEGAQFDIVSGPKTSTQWDSVFDTVTDGNARLSRESRQLAIMHAAADIVVCSGGYNSLVESIQGNASIIAVPVQIPGDDGEQRLHGQLLSQFCDLEVVKSISGLERALRSKIEAHRRGTPPQRPVRLDLNGAARIRDIVLDDFCLRGVSAA